MRYLTSFSLSAFLFLTSFCQKPTRPVLIGEKVPDISFGTFMNDPKKKLSVPDMRGKLLLLDFWDIWCTSCISAMPKLDSLQKKFGNKIQIILITNNNQKEVEKLFGKVKIKRPDLPMIINDRVFQKMFPHNTVPHHVWVDKNGIVKFITNGYNANTENIQAVLNNQDIKLYFKNESEDFDPDQSLWTEGNMRLAKHLKYYSFFMNRIDEYGGSFYKIPFIDSVQKRAGIRIVNMPILFYYKVAFTNEIPDGSHDENRKELLNNRVILEVENPEMLQIPESSLKKDEWADKNIFSYELNVPLNKRTRIYSIMQQDLDNFFTYSGRVENRKVKCLVLVRTSGKDYFRSGNEKTKVEANEETLQLRNVSIPYFVWLLNYSNNSFKSLPIINGTGYSGNVDLNIKAKLNDLPALQKQLALYDLNLVERVEEIPMLVIRSK